MNCKPGDLARVVRAPAGASLKVDAIVKVLSFAGTVRVIASGTGVICEEDDCWFVEYNGASHGDLSLPYTKHDSDLRPIRDQPGNESFVVEARKSLPKSTKGDTITERGELA